MQADAGQFCEPQLKAIIARTQPDVIVEDNVVGFPALTTAGAPFVRIVSCNPLEVKDPGIAPVFSSYPASSRDGWAEFVPQTSVIPQVDLVITHGGNNTTTESLHFGKPMICLPLFWNQYDNAQRVDELGLGVRLAPYTFTQDEMVNAIDSLLADSSLRARLAAEGERIRAADGLRHAADLIEAAGR